MTAEPTPVASTVPGPRAPGDDRAATSPALLDRVVSGAPVAVVVLDATLHVVHWNPAAERLFGWPADEVLGRPYPLGELPEQDRRDCLALIEAGLAGVPSGRQEVRRVHRDGTLLEVEVTSSPLRDEQGRVVGLVAVFDDDSGRRRLQRSLDARVRQQVAVAALGQAALRADDVPAVLSAACDTILDALGLLAVTVSPIELVTGSAVAEPVQAQQRPADRVGAPRSRRDRPTFRLADGRHLDEVQLTAWLDATATTVVPQRLSARALRSGGRLLVQDLAGDPGVCDAERSVLLSLGARSVAVVRIGSSDRPWGTLLALGADTDAFRPDELEFLGAVANIIAGVAARAVALAEARHRAWHDALTELPNRDLLNHRLGEALRHQQPGRHCALLLIDLDEFKDVNDSQGHQAGDDVLRQVAQRLQGRLRTSDTVARLGGDEFAVLLPDLPDADAATGVAGDLVTLLRQPFDTPAGPVCLGGSIGIAAAGAGSDPYGLLQRADLAMYRAKRDRLGFAVHDPQVDDALTERLWMVADLRAAIEQDELWLAYQPIVDLASGRARAVEALCRWTHPTRGPQNPATFVALAESSGLAGDLTDLVLRRAMEQYRHWLRDGLDLGVGVNLPPGLLRSGGYADYLLRMATANGMPLPRLRVEVTESTVASDDAVSVLRRLREAGIRIAVDDFGTGWSSLARLKELPVDVLKIDRSFVVNVLRDRRDAAIARSVVALAGELGLDTIAEGVEDEPTARLLRELGVMKGQGYLWARPLPAADVAAWFGALPRP